MPSRILAAKSLDRRQLIAGAGLGFLSCLRPQFAEALQRSEAMFASAYRDSQNGYGIAVLDEKGRILWHHKLQQRGHGLASHRPSGRLVIFARRPGLFALAFKNAAVQSNPTIITSREGRHFYGHGVYSSDGKTLYATENDYENSRGLIGLYDAENGYKRLGEFDSGGIGPHELVTTIDGKYLVVANGGIETHPDFGRAKLNLATMAPSLSVIEIDSGEMIESHRLPLSQHQMSLRHLAVGADGRIWFGGQWQGQGSHIIGEKSGDEAPDASLIGNLEIGKGLSTLPVDPAALSGLKSYVGSVAISADGLVGTASSPRGGEVVYWHTDTGNIFGRKAVANVCGVAADADNGLALSAGAQGLRINGALVPATESFSWDNHLLRI